MIIKKAIINNFGKIKDKEIDLKDGLNIIYGENEKGKSTIENFIKAWLFGFSNVRGNKNNLRKKYMPFTGEKMRGELIVSFEGREYIIKRSFGNTKKDDESIILDSLTGEEIKEINKDAPGEYFLEINGNTFSKTLFIPQLGVQVSKDKDEQIIEKIIELFGCGEGEVSVDKAIDKLKENRKSITTTRKSGRLDILKNRYNYVIEERYESYNIAEENLENEEMLQKEKEKKEVLKEDIKKLDLYKKHNKKMQLQKEYKEINTYLKRSENLKREEEELNRDLVKENGSITISFIDELASDNNRYLALLDTKCEKELDLRSLKEEYEKNVLEDKSFEVFDSMDDGIKEKLIKLNLEQETLKDKILKGDSLKKSIEDEEIRLSQKKKFLGDIIKLKDNKDEIKDLFNLYEERLNMLKGAITKAPNSEKIKNNKEKVRKEKNISGGIIIVSILIAILNFSILGGGALFYIISFIGLVLGTALFIKSNKELNNLNSKGKLLDEVDYLNKDIKNIEDKLNGYMDTINCNSYENLLRAINSLNNYLALEEKTFIVLEERRKNLNDFDVVALREKYLQNSKVITSIIKVSGANSIEEVYEKLDAYKKVKDNTINLEIQIKTKSEELDRINYELQSKEKNIKEKLIYMNIEGINLVNLDVYLKDVREKLNKKSDLENALKGVEETYKVLLKDRDIDSIKEELKDILNIDGEYSYKNEEDIELEIRSKSNELIETEKRIKDLENEIKSSFLGRRDISRIEEDLNNITEEISSLEIRLKAIDLAIETLLVSGREIKNNFGPTLNKKICENFKKLTSDKYKEVKLNDDYGMLVRDSKDMFNSDFLSCGANDQLYLALRIAFIELIFKNAKVPVILDDTFIQYDDIRRKNAMHHIMQKGFEQIILFTCQKIDLKIAKELELEFNYISI